MRPLYSTVWERGPGQNSVYWQGPDEFLGIPQAPIASPPNVNTGPHITVPYRPFFSPTGLQASGMYSRYGASGIQVREMYNRYGASAPRENVGGTTPAQRWLLYAALLGGGFLLAKSLSPGGLKSNPRMKIGERLVRMGAGSALTVAGAIGWFGPQAAEPITTIVGLPLSISGIYLLMSGLTSPETAQRIRKEVKL